MQNLYGTYQNVKEKLKQLLCARRNNTKTLFNPFHSNQKSQTMVRKNNRIPPSVPQSNPPNNYPQLNQSQQPKSQEMQQIDAPELPPQQINTLVKTSIYTLNFLEQDYEDKSQPLTEAEILIKSQMTLDNYESQLKKTIQQIQFLKQKDEQRKKHFWKHVYTNFSNEKLDQDLSSIIDENQHHNDQILNDNQLYSLYKTHIQDIRDLKYSAQLNDYPEISFEEYSNIRNLWAFAKKNPNHIIKNMKLKILQKLLARSFKTLSFGIWLNDEIINAYLEMIDNKSAETGKKYKVLNSFFAKTTFSKSKDMVLRALKRKNISEQNQIIIAINNGTHWFFARIMNKKVVVYDSIPKEACLYESGESTREIFANIIEFSNWFYGGQHQIEVEARYPKQANGSDCGMFLLCGIKDIVRDYKQWSFCQDDMPYKRIQVAKQLFDEQISGFNF